MFTATEVATHAHVEAALEGGIDLLWIGARTAANPFAMQEIADSLKGVDIPVLVKNPSLLKELLRRLAGEDYKDFSCQAQELALRLTLVEMK